MIKNHISGSPSAPVTFDPGVYPGKKKEHEAGRINRASVGGIVIIEPGARTSKVAGQRTEDRSESPAM